MNNKINKIRGGIDDVDDKILKLISKRGELAQKIGNCKKTDGKEIYVPSREREIFNKLIKKNLGPFTDEALRAIFREVISATRALEEPIKVSYLGPEATFTHQAAKEHFGHGAQFVSEFDISSVFHQVEKSQVDYGVVPIENSIEGVINYTLDKFVVSDLKICSEIILPVELNLLSMAAGIESIKTIYSHPHALAQCRSWIAANLPKAKQVHIESTARAAKKLINNRNAGAIASRLAGDCYGLNILASKVQDATTNFTRFLVIGKTLAKKTGSDKTSLAFIAKDKPGILYHLLKPLAEAKINLTKIESRPLKTKAWEYMFFIDLDGHMSERKIQKALEGLKEGCSQFKVLGSYPKA